MNSKKLLIICYSFPPFPGIGGRRWAKFANYLFKLEVDIQVLSAFYEGNEKSEWQKDTIALAAAGRVHSFKSAYPKIIQSIPKSIFAKIKYHVTLKFLKWKIKGNFYDRSALCKKAMLAEVEKFIEKGYMDIIISVGPFMYANHLLAIKKRYPDVKLFLDVRDPWTNNKTAFGYSTLSPARFRVEKEAEREVALGYDKIITVADDIGAYFVNEYGINEGQVVTIKNGFDTADFKFAKSDVDAKKVLIFTGNLYQKAEKSFLMLVNQLKGMKAENSDFFNHYECHFYGEIHDKFTPYFSKEINLFFKGKISLEDVFIKIAQSSACLLFLTDDLNYSFSTKFYEYLSQKRPIVVFSNPGKTGKFVEENNIGRQADSENLSMIINDIESGSFYKRGFDINEFEFGNLTKQLIKHVILKIEPIVLPEIEPVYRKEIPKILFVAYQFPPAGGPGVQRSVKFVHYLRENHYEPVVLTISEEHITKSGVKVDSSLNKLIPENTEIIRVASYQPIRIIKVLSILRIFRLFWFIFYPLFWEKSALWPFMVYGRAVRKIRSEDIRLVYTTSGPFSSLILGFLLKKKLKIKWVADLRDPFTDGYQWSFPSKLHWYVMRKLEKWILSKADQLIVNTEEVKKLYLIRGILPSSRITVIMNGF